MAWGLGLLAQSSRLRLRIPGEIRFRIKGMLFFVSRILPGGNTTRMFFFDKVGIQTLCF